MKSMARQRQPICKNTSFNWDFGNIRICGLVNFVCVLSLCRTGFGTVQHVTVYPSSQHTKYYLLYDKNLTWREAYHHCIGVGGILASQGWSRDFSYIKNALLREEWTGTNNIWIGVFKYGQDNRWLVSRDCRTTHNLVINNERNDELQCLSINMTSENILYTLFYAASCDIRTAHVCRFSTLRIEDATDVYKLYNNMTIHNESMDHTSVATSLDDCIIQAFAGNCFKCYGSEYFDSSNECHIYRRDLNHLPGTVTIMDSFDERILMLKKTHKVLIDNDTTPVDTSGLSDSDLPCSEPTTFWSTALTTTKTTAPTETSDLSTTESTAPILTRTDTLASTSHETIGQMITNISVSKTDGTKSSIMSSTEAGITTPSESTMTTVTGTDTSVGTTTDTVVFITNKAPKPTIETNTFHSTTYSTIIPTTTVISVTKTTDTNELTITSDLTSSISELSTTVNSTLTTMEASTTEQITTKTSTTTTTMTTTFASLPNVKMCPCYCNKLSRPEEEIQREIEARKKELVVDKKSLSAHTRKKTSAKDDRVSSRTVGFTGVFFLSLVLLLIFLNDFISFLSFISRS